MNTVTMNTSQAEVLVARKRKAEEDKRVSQGNLDEDDRFARTGFCLTQFVNGMLKMSLCESLSAYEKRAKREEIGKDERTKIDGEEIKK